MIDVKLSETSFINKFSGMYSVCVADIRIKLNTNLDESRIGHVLGENTVLSSFSFSFFFFFSFFRFFRSSSDRFAFFGFL